jgi:hypothetical protein
MGLSKVGGLGAMTRGSMYLPVDGLRSDLQSEEALSHG